MDESFFSESSKRQISIQACLWIFFTIYALQIVLLGIFAFNNPDNDQSWYSKDTETLYVKEDLAEDTVNMHGRFLIWLKWGFWNHVLAVALLIFGSYCKPIGYQPIRYRFYVTSLISLSCLLVCSFQFWSIIGAVWRFNKAGRITCGDYLGRPEDEKVNARDWLKEVKDDGYQITTGSYIGVFHYPVLLMIFNCCCCC